MNGKKWFYSILILLAVSLLAIGGCVFWTDPFFHYRSPRPYLFYDLEEQRYQNDGITKHFDYDAIITGTSMTENFSASEFDSLFGTNSIKVPFSGATYKEIEENLKVSYESGHSPRYVLRGLDYTLLVRGKDDLRLDMGEYPEYLTNKNPIDDVKYLLNRDAVVTYTIPMLIGYLKGEEGGHTDFDVYSYTASRNLFSKEEALAGRSSFSEPEQINGVREDEMEMVTENIESNVLSVASAHPETTFLYFFPPYSMAYFGGLKEDGDLEKELEYKKQAIEMMLQYDNIHIYSFTMETDITADLDRYRDQAHYDENVSSWIIEKIAEAENGQEASSFRITRDNVQQYLDEEKDLLMNYDYNSLID
jgi:hypothetical protein